MSRAASDAAPAVIPEPAPELETQDDAAGLPGRSIDYSDVWLPEPELPAEALRARCCPLPRS